MGNITLLGNFDNKDGRNRQDIHKKCSKGDAITLNVTTYKGKPSVEVWVNSGQIGHISADEAEEVRDALVNGEITDAEINGLYGGTKDKPTIGCEIITT